MANLNNTLLFASPRNYSADNDRIEIRGTSTPVPEMVDNDYQTHSTEDDVDVNVADADGNPTTIHALFVKYTGDLVVGGSRLQVAAARMSRARCLTRSPTTQARRFHCRLTGSSMTCIS